MRLLWIHRASSSAEGGAIYDDKMRRALSGAHEIVSYPLHRNSRAQQIVRAATQFSLPEQFGVGTPEDVVALRGMLRNGGFDAAVFSHEHLDTIAAALRSASVIPFITIRHNVTSDAMASVFADAPALATVYRTLAERQERATLRSDLFAAIIAISERDRVLLRDLSGGKEVALAVPGAPPAAPLADDAECERALVLGGTFDWFPKAKGLRAFAADFARDPIDDVRVYVSETVPPAIRTALRAENEADLAWDKAIRFGIVTDRFTAGHKLKTGAYLMKNCMVFSFAPVRHDFTFSPIAAKWIHEVHSMAEIRDIVNATLQRPAAELRAELVALKAKIGTQLAWESQAQVIIEQVERVLKQTGNRQLASA